LTRIGAFFRAWKSAARKAREQQHRITCRPTGPERDALTVEFAAHTQAGRRSAGKHRQTSPMTTEGELGWKVISTNRLAVAFAYGDDKPLVKARPSSWACSKK